MAFFLTPRHVPTFQTQSCNPFGYFGAPAPQPPYRRVVHRQPFPSFAPFLTQVDELLAELDREARRQQHQQRQQRKRAFRARFDVRENKEGYEVDGEVPGFVQENISIEVTDDHTLKVSGNTETGTTTKQPEAQAPVEPAKAIETAKEKDVEMDGATLNEPETVHSDTSSQRSYQATVEDDFEDLGAETSSTVSEGSTTTAPKEPKGKEKVVEPATAETAVQPAPKDEPERKEWVSERQHGSFERTFRFPERINGETVRAALKNGVLSITVPKAPAHQVRHITIQ